MTAQWWTIQYGTLTYEVLAESYEQAYRLFESWIGFPVEVDWLRRVAII